MTFPRRLSLLMTGALLAGAFMAGPVFAQSTEQRVEQLEQDMQGMNRKLDALWELMQQQVAGGSAVQVPAAAASAPVAETQVAIPESIRMGQLYLDLFSEELTDEQFRLLERHRAPAPIVANTAPLESAVVDAAAKFELGAFLKQPTMAHYNKSGGLLVSRWNGVFSIFNQGEHVFALRLVRNEGGSGPYQCRGVLKLNEQQLIDNQVYAPRSGTVNLPFDQTEQGKISLAPGFYELEFVLTCVGNRAVALQTTFAELRLMEPGDRAPQLVEANRFGIRE